MLQVRAYLFRRIYLVTNRLFRSCLLLLYVILPHWWVTTLTSDLPHHYGLISCLLCSGTLGWVSVTKTLALLALVMLSFWLLSLREQLALTAPWYNPELYKMQYSISSVFYSSEWKGCKWLLEQQFILLILWRFLKPFPSLLLSPRMQ